MALIKCKECGNEISDTARSCPRCGAYHRGAIEISSPIVLLVLRLGGIFFILLGAIDISLCFSGLVDDTNKTGFWGLAGIVIGFLLIATKGKKK
jgi:hypothetical protein